MHSSRIIVRSPQVCRIIKAAPAATRGLSLLSPHIFPRAFPAAGFQSSLSSELAPLFRLMDDFASSPARTLEQFLPQQQRPFAPRFDVRELGDSYELRGELPGVQSKDLDVEFTDAHTLVIRGRTASEISSSSRTDAVAEAANPESTEPVTAAAADTTAVDNSDAMSTLSSSSYQHATVEDEPNTTSAADESSTPAPQTQEVAQPTPAPAAEQPAAETPRYWLSERRTGTFQRTFTFPSRIDATAVRARLSDGILSVVVPKAVVDAPRRIAVE